jgi:hypothetical protein
VNGFDYRSFVLDVDGKLYQSQSQSQSQSSLASSFNPLIYTQIVVDADNQNNRNRNRHSPVLMDDIECDNIRFMCKSKSKSNVYCWGFLSHSYSGQYSFALPQIVSCLTSPMILIKSIACGEWHSAVLTQQGQVYCWGMNNYAQLATDIHKLAFSLTPILVEFESDEIIIAQISSGSRHTCAIAESQSGNNKNDKNNKYQIYISRYTKTGHHKCTSCCKSCTQLLKKYNFQDKVFTFENNKIIPAIVENPGLCLAYQIKYNLFSRTHIQAAHSSPTETCQSMTY